MRRTCYIHPMRASKTFVQAALSAQGHAPNKNLGQNFCVDGEKLTAFVHALPLEGQTVLEIGPGLGGLTELLLAAGARVYAVEKDPRLYAFLKEDLQHPNLTLILGDCLKTDYRFLPGDFFAVGNLPYCITADAVNMLLSLAPKGMLLMLQQEAAERFFAEPGQKIYGPTAMVTGLYYTPSRLGTLPPEAYYPAPTVTSALVRLVRRADAPTESPKELLKFAAACLRMRRKTLYNNLTNVPGLMDMLAQMGLSPSVRGEALTGEQLLELYRRIHS